MSNALERAEPGSMAGSACKPALRSIGAARRHPLIAICRATRDHGKRSTRQTAPLESALWRHGGRGPRYETHGRAQIVRRMRPARRDRRPAVAAHPEGAGFLFRSV